VSSTLNLRSLIEENKGYLFTSDVSSAGISKKTLATFIQENKLEKVAHGIYITEDTWLDELFVLSRRNENIVFSHETALYLHGLMEREPTFVTVTVKFGYNASHLTKNGIKVVTAITDFYEVGIGEATTKHNHIVRTYDMERTICDMVRNKEKMDPQVFRTAMREYMTNRKKRLPILMSYASTFGIANRIRTYTEVLL